MGQESAIGLWEQFSGLDEIWAVGRRKDRLEKLEEKVNIPVRKFALDLSQEKDRELLKEKLVRLKPQVKFLVNAAGFGKIGNVCDLPEKDVDKGRLASHGRRQQAGQCCWFWKDRQCM